MSKLIKKHRLIAGFLLLLPFSMSVAVGAVIDIANSETEISAEQHQVTEGQAKALRSLKPIDDSIKNIQITAVELTDNQGLRYIGGLVNHADVQVYVEQLAHLLPFKYKAYRQNQMQRDHGKFHVTLVNPIEYQSIDKSKLFINKTINVTLHGLGKVSQGLKTTYFVVASSSQGQFYRQMLSLAPKDFHVTLGFSPEDVYGVSKGRDTLIR